MKIREIATWFVDYLKKQGLTTISPATLKFAFIEWWDKTGKTNTTKLIIDYLIVTKVIIPISNDKNKDIKGYRPDYTINYARNEQLKDSEFCWLKEDTQIENELKAILKHQAQTQGKGT